MPGPLTEQLTAVCDESLARIGQGRVRDALSAVRTRLVQPLRVAIGGREKAGKSTLVNALLGQRIAQTAAGTCTKVVTWFRYDYQERVEVRPYTGHTKVFPLRGGQLPSDDDLGLTYDEIADIAVHLSNAGLRDKTVIDTPGLASLKDEYSQRSREFFSFDAESVDAVAQADALVYLFQQLRQDDQLSLQDFRSAFPGANVSALNSVGVLSRVDTLAGHTPDPWPDAHRIASKYAHQFRTLVADIVPVMGLLAETTSTGVFTEADAIDLRRLSGLDSTARRRLLLSADRFKGSNDAPIPADRRERLLGLLGLYGLRQAIEFVSQGIDSSAGLVRHLRELSGVAPLQALIEDSLTRRADPLKAGAAISSLEAITFRFMDAPEARELRGLRRAIERVRLHPDMHQLEEMEAVRLLSSSDVWLPDDLQTELLRVTTQMSLPARLGLEDGASPDQLERAAREGASRWQALENGPKNNRATERVARTLKLSYVYLFSSVRNLRERA
jgi:hypothetical protein